MACGGADALLMALDVNGLFWLCRVAMHLCWPLMLLPNVLLANHWRDVLFLIPLALH